MSPACSASWTGQDRPRDRSCEVFRVVAAAPWGCGGRSWQAARPAGRMGSVAQELLLGFGDPGMPVPMPPGARPLDRRMCIPSAARASRPLNVHHARGTSIPHPGYRGRSVAPAGGIPRGRDGASRGERSGYRRPGPEVLTLPPSGQYDPRHQAGPPRKKGTSRFRSSESHRSWSGHASQHAVSGSTFAEERIGQGCPGVDDRDGH